MYMIGYCCWSGSGPLIHIKSWQETLGGIERSHEIFEWYKGVVCICVGRKEECVLGYTDADYVGDMDKRRSTSSYVFIFTGGAISW